MTVLRKPQPSNEVVNTPPDPKSMVFIPIKEPKTKNSCCPSFCSLFHKPIAVLNTIIQSVSGNKPQFTTMAIKNKSNIEQVVKIVSLWRLQAEVNFKLAKALIRNQQISEHGYSVAKESLYLIKALDRDIKILEKHNALYVCYDKNNIIQSIAVTSDQTHVDLLATNPNNIALPGNEQNRTKGAGTAIITAIAQEALVKNGQNIRLEPLPAAVGFYEKLGFVKETNEKNMQLSFAAKEELVKKNRAMVATTSEST